MIAILKGDTFMRTLAKFFTLIGTIAGAIGILPLIFGILALKKMKNAQSKDETIAMGVLNIIFCSPLGGIFMLCIPASDYPAGKPAEAPAEENAEA